MVGYGLSSRLCCMNVRSLILLLTGLLACGAVRASEPVKLWFTPWLQTNSDPVCASALQNAIERFLSPLPWSFDTVDNASMRQSTLGELRRVPSAGYSGYQSSATFEYLEGQRQYRLTQPNGVKVYVAFQTLRGCGGACEREQVIISEQSFAGGEPVEHPYVTTPDAFQWQFFRSSDGTYFLVAVTEGHIKAFRIVVPSRWKLSCDIAIAPEEVRKNPDPALRAVLASMDSFEIAVNGMTRDAGDCGTSATAYRWSGYRAQEYGQALYRPWSMQSPDPPNSDELKSENSAGDYSRIREQLKTWSLGGLLEQQAYTRYIEQLDSTSAALASFYSDKFGWPLEHSRRVAEGALTTAVSSGMGFYLYEPFATANERSLREAILSHQPMQDIRGIDLDADVASRLLDIAVGYPEVLRYLFEHGARADWTNAFGKTALMYAAQYDQFKSAQILLEHGANPNAATYMPTDTCAYTLRTAGMTPLHYAVRYASANVINLLLERGAVGFRRATNGLPIDWLRRYSDPGATEVNSKLTSDDRLRIAARLQPLDMAVLEKTAVDLIHKSRQEYAAGRPEQAFRSVDLALQASPGNREALALLQLAALRTGRNGVSLEAGESLVPRANDARELANIRFNLGLACENEKYLSYNGRYYCTGDPVWNFLEAWKLAPTAARRNKLNEVLTAPRSETCVVDAGSADARHYRFEFQQGFGDGKARQVQRIYVRHASDRVLDKDAISWKTNRWDAGKVVPTRTVPARVARLDLGRFAVSIYESEFMAQAPVQVEAQLCDLK